MQNVPPTNKALSPALKNGLIFGLIAGAIIIVFDLIDFSTHLTSLFARAMAQGSVSTYAIDTLLISFAHGICNLLIIAALCAFAGYRAKKTSAKAYSGLLAGLWGGLTTAIMLIFYALIILFAVTLPQLANLVTTTSPATKNIVIVSAIFGLILGVVLNTCAGLAGGAIGGALVRRKPEPLFYQYPYPPQPYAPQYPQQPYNPQYPPQPYAPQYPQQPYNPPRPVAPQD